ncbi:MAG: nitroreductase family deazaflavin-dependent oxidoreductase [Anaerolineales bacterium]|nr:nitroreductase family deazaflavin-dependent oxidoreductase [Anaerolineales bacterium]
MAEFKPPPKTMILRLYRSPLGLLLGRFILLLTTRGRKSGLPRVTPLQYEKVDGDYCLGSARGVKADWVRNILTCPEVELQVKNKKISGKADVVTDPMKIADFLELRLRRHPVMVGRIMEMDGLSRAPSRAELEAYAVNLAMVIVHPV